MKKMIIQVPKASCFNYSDQITTDDIDNAISIIDKLFENGRYRKNRPTFQTIDNLFLFDQFNKFQFTFLDACKKLTNISNPTYQSFSFCYMDYYDNWIKKTRNEQWHNHSEADLFGIMYLKNYEYPDNIQSGTEFANDYLESIGFIDPIPFSWHLFVGNTYHRPGVITTNNKRYVLTSFIKYN
jgi:hypothetical protein